MVAISRPPAFDAAPASNTPVERASLLDAMQGIMDASIAKAARNQSLPGREEAQAFGRNVATTLPAENLVAPDGPSRQGDGKPI
jgi:hypothetical protein